MVTAQRTVVDLLASDLIARMTDTAQAPLVICAWHEDLTTARNRGASHGICADCLKKMEAGLA